MADTIYHLRITLRGSKPAIWRRVAVPLDITLGQLHEVVQIAMGWTDSHLHQFVLRGERVFMPMTTPFGEPTEMEGEDEDAVTLDEVCPKIKGKLIYEYDFGDGWEHIIEVQKIEAPKAGVEYPVCLSGKKACPPEDCGGIYGYCHMLEVIADPEHEEHDDLAEWLDDDFDPDAFDIDEVNAMLAEWRKG
jgi:hypothetical protein